MTDMKRIVILGAAESGAGAAVLAKKQGFDVFVSDFGSIKDSLGISQSVTSQHLKLLRVARLVRWRKDGKSVIYALNDDHISRILALGTEHYEETIGPEA